MANSELSNENACLVVNTLMEDHKRIPRYQPIGKESNPQIALKDVGQLKIHPGNSRNTVGFRYKKEKMAGRSLLIESPKNALRSGGGQFLYPFPPSGYSQNRASDMKCWHRPRANKSTRPQASSDHRR
jgi:hypothetical protein